MGPALPTGTAAPFRRRPVSERSGWDSPYSRPGLWWSTNCSTHPGRANQIPPCGPREGCETRRCRAKSASLDRTHSNRNMNEAEAEWRSEPILSEDHSRPRGSHAALDVDRCDLTSDNAARLGIVC